MLTCRSHGTFVGDMRDDYTPTNPEPIEALSAQFDALRKDPTQEDLYVELRDQLRAKGLTQRVAEAAEIRAPADTVPERAAQTWADAGEARLLLGQAEPGERALRKSLALDSTND